MREIPNIEKKRFRDFCDEDGVIDFNGWIKEMRESTRTQRAEAKKERNVRIKDSADWQRLSVALRWDSLFYSLSDEFYKISFSQLDYDVTTCIKEGFGFAERFVENFERTPIKTLILWGNPGTGKSLASFCLRNCLFDKGIIGLYLSAKNIIEADKREYARLVKDGLAESSYILIDQLGSEPRSQYGESVNFQIADFLDCARKKSLKVIVTTNGWICDCLSKIDCPQISTCKRKIVEGDPVDCTKYSSIFEWLKKRYDYQISSLLAEGAMVIPMFGQDYRLKEMVG